MKGNAYYILFVILFCIICLFYVNRLLDDNKDLKNKVQNIQQTNEVLIEGFFHYFDFVNHEVDLGMEIKKNEKSNSTIWELANGENALFLFIEYGSCNSCDLNHILNFANIRKSSKINMILCIAGFDYKEFSAFTKNYNIDDFSFMIESNAVSAFSVSSVFYFLVDKNFYTKCYYAPSNNLSNITEHYFNEILYHFEN